MPVFGYLPFAQSGGQLLHGLAYLAKEGHIQISSDGGEPGIRGLFDQISADRDQQHQRWRRIDRHVLEAGRVIAGRAALGWRELPS